MATVVDVAQKAGVSPATVSRVLLARDKDKVAPETRLRVLEAVEALGYQPNPMAQGLRMGRGRSVALLVGDIEQGVYSSLTKHLQAALEAIDLELLLFNLGHRQDRLRGLLERAVAMRIRGICIASSDVISIRALNPLLQDLTDAEIPVVSVGQRLDRHGIISVARNDAAGAVQAVQHLAARGHTPIAYLGRVKHSSSGSERFRGYKKGLAQAGIALDKELVWIPDKLYRYEAGYEEMSKALERGVKVRGILAASDELALGAVAAALDRKLRIPEDLAFVGVGGLSWGAHVRPSLTTLAAAPEDIGKKVSEIFRSIEDGEQVPLLSTVAMTLIHRASS